MYSNQPNQSSAQAGYGVNQQTSAEVPRPSLRFDGSAVCLEELIKGLAEANMRLARVADRLGGTTPEPVEKDGANPIGNSVAGRYERIADTYSTLIRKLFSAVERLEQL